MIKLISFLLVTLLSYSQLVDFKTSLDISKGEYRERRQKLMNRLPDYPLIFIGNTNRNRINDTQYEFRQESNFYYLSGFNEPNGFLIISRKPFTFQGEKINELIFVPENDVRSMTWTGKRLGTLGAKEILGFVNAQTTFRKKANNFKAFMKKLVKEFPKFYLMTPIINAKTIKDKRSYFQRYSDDLAEILQSETIEIQNIKVLVKELRTLRGVKSKKELEILQRAVDITISGHHESFKIAKNVNFEYQVEAAIEFAFKFNGAKSVGYNSIVGCGENGTILHYNANRSKINHNEIFCIDAGAEYQNYTADITRSFPANGIFSAAQREIYNIVLAAQSAGAMELVAGSNYQLVDWVVKKKMAEGLSKLGIIKFQPEAMTLKFIKNTKDLSSFCLAASIQAGKNFIPVGTTFSKKVIRALEKEKKNTIKVYDIKQLHEIYPHGWGHHVGLDVHDLGEYKNFKVGMVWTIEPGLYISNRVSFDINKKYHNIGIRIEDMYEITKNGNRCMSSKLPKTVNEIEKYMKQSSGLLLNSKVQEKDAQ